MLSLGPFLIISCLNPGSSINRPVIPKTTATSTVSDEIQYHILRAMLHAEEANWKECNTHFELAAKRRPYDPYLHMHWGNAALKLGQNREAIHRYKEALGRFGVHRSDLRAGIRTKINQAELKTD